MNCEKKEQQDTLVWRILAFVIDGYIIIAIRIVLMCVFYSSFKKDVRLTFIVFLVLMVLLLFKDVVGIGKRIMRLEVIDKKTGKKARWYKKIYRNIPLVFLYPFELFFALHDRRLGDKIAKTIVKKKPPNKRI